MIAIDNKGNPMWIDRNKQCSYCKNSIEGCDHWLTMQEVKTIVDKLEREKDYFGIFDFKCKDFYYNINKKGGGR